MATLSPIAPETHSTKTWRGPVDHRFAANDVLIPIGMSEAPRAALYLPLGFALINAAPKLVAIAGFEQRQSLLVGNDGGWLAGYLPQQYRCFPFVVASVEDGSRALCLLDDGVSLIDGPGGAPFFAIDGSLDPKVKEVLDLLVGFERDKAAADHFSKALYDAGVIRPWELTIPGPSGPRKLEGLHHVNEAAFDALEDEAFLSLRKAGALNLAYSQMISTQNLLRLTELWRARHATPLRSGLGAPAMELDFSGMGG